MVSTRLPRSVWIPVLGLALIIFGWRLSSVPLTNWDEGIYANVNLELFHSHDWTKLTYFGADFLEKPPLQFWLTSVLFGIFGATELAIRFLSAAAGVGTALLLTLWIWQALASPQSLRASPPRAGGRRWPSVMTGVVFVLGQFALVHAFRTGDLDGLLTFFITLAIYGYWKSWTVPRWIVLWGAASAAAVMTKSFVGLLPFIIVGTDILLSRGWRKIGWGNIAWAVGAFMALAAPWHIIETIRFGQAFWDSYVGVHVIERTAESLFTVTPWHWYLNIILQRFAPFSYFLPLAFLAAGWRWTKDRGSLDRLIIVWSVVTAVIFSLIQTRREWYILPIYPGLAMMLVVTMRAWWDERPSRLLQVGFLVSSLFAFGHVLTEHRIRLALGHFSLTTFLTTAWWRSWAGQLVFGAVVVALLILLAVLARRWRGTWWRRYLGLTVAAMTLAGLAWSLLYIHDLPATLPLKTIATRIEREQIGNVSLIGTALKKQPAGYFYILRMETHSAEYPVGTPPVTPLVLTTDEAKNAPLNTRGKTLLHLATFLLLDLR